MNIPEDLVSNTMMDTIRMQVQETQDEFIFLTISNFIEREYAITVSKEELVQAMYLLQNYKVRGYDVSERWATAIQQTALLNREYRRGFQDGVKKEHDRIESIIKEEKKK